MKSEFTTNRESVSYKTAFQKVLNGLQKGVSKGLKGHLLQANWASLRSQKSIC